MGARLDVDDLVELKVELDELGRRIAAASHRVGELLAVRPSPTATGTAGMPCVADITWDPREEDAVATHKMEPLNNASLHDEPPSRPA